MLLADPRLPDFARFDAAARPEHDRSDCVRRALELIPSVDFRYLDDHSRLSAELSATRPQFVLNLCRGGFQNCAERELHVPALLEMLRIAYSGPGPECVAACQNKVWLRAIAREAGVKVPCSYSLESVEFPVRVLAANGQRAFAGSTITSVKDWPTLAETLSRARSSVLVEEYLPGVEYSVGLIGNPPNDLRSLAVLERSAASGAPWHLSEIATSARAEMVESARVLFEKLQCRDCARFDFRTAADGTVKLLAVDPSPDWSCEGELNRMAAGAGIAHADLLAEMIRVAEARYEWPPFSASA